MTKKSQITLFLILGVIILIAGMFFFFTSQQNVKVSIEENQITTEQTPVEFEPVVDFIESCLYDTAYQAVTIIGEQGGYIDLKKTQKKIVADPTSSEGVIFSQESNLIIPYWYYLKSDNLCTENCQFAYGRPYLLKIEGSPSIEEEIEKYIEMNLGTCLNGFESFKVQGFKIDLLLNPDAQVLIREYDLVFNLDMPLLISRNSQKKIQFYSSTMDLELREIYKQATILTNLEAQYHYLEKDALNMIFAFSGLDKEKLPPFSDMEFELGEGISWNKNEVKSHVEDILASYVQFMQVYGSSTYKPYPAEPGSFKDAIFNAGKLIVDNETQDYLEYSFTYLDFWPLYFHMNCDAQCRAETVGADYLPIFGIQKYEFYYDISYPVYVEIKDKEALNNRGYTFKFFLESNIRNNEPMKPAFNQLDMPDISESSLLCEPNNRHSGDVSIHIVDPMGNKIDGAQILFSCADQGCSIGKSVQGEFKGKLPVCLGGFVSIVGEDYVGESSLISPQIDKQYDLNFVLEPIKNLRVDVKKYTALKDNEWNPLSSPVPLTKDENAIIILERIGDINEKEFGSYTEFSLGTNTTIQIAPGTYHLQLIVENANDLIIPKDNRKEGTFPFENSFEVPEIRINESYNSGGADINITITQEDLINEKVTFYAIIPDLLAIPLSQRKMEDIDKLNMVGAYSKEYYYLLRPIFEHVN